MALDTASKEFMNLLSSFGGPPLWELPIGDARTAVNGLSTQLCGPLTDVHEVIDRKISGPTGEFGIRLYTPKASRKLLPIVLHYHGGGWALCNLDTHDAIARFYCKHADAIVVSVDYRLAPEHKFPAAVDDSFAAFCWAVDHAGEFGGDPKRVAGSAGLAAARDRIPDPILAGDIGRHRTHGGGDARLARRARLVSRGPEPGDPGG